MKLKKGLSFCMYEFNLVRKQTLELYEELVKNYSKVRTTYSGRGFHIHVFDEDTYKLARKERLKIAQRLSKNMLLMNGLPLAKCDLSDCLILCMEWSQEYASQ
ncbi:MAG: hypothetical protein QMC98_02360 [Candidatus Thermoplasmatota archaeon]|nr:hypothetical protein [Candidatus Thermoplasmatota archaeon]